MARNLKEIRVHAMMRSGHHGIINWIVGHFKDGYVIHRNDAIEYILKGWPPNYAKYGEPKRNRDCYLLSFEDIWPSKVESLYEENKELLFHGKSNEIFNVFVIRDPLNMFASRRKFSINQGTTERKGNRTGKVGWIDDKAIALWKEYAARYVNPEPGDIWIDFNEWHKNHAYRQVVSAKLGLPFSDEGFEIVSGHGYGSSFDGQRFDGKASDMLVLERYKELLNDEEYIVAVTDPEILDLYDRLWDEIPKELK